MDFSKYDHSQGDKNIVFTISNCCLHKKFTLNCMTNDEVKILLNRLKNIEKYSWHQFANLQDRAIGLTPEIQGTESYQYIYEQDDRPDKELSKHYFHFRVKAKELFRVFGFQNKDKFCITHLDVKGLFHH